MLEDPAIWKKWAGQRYGQHRRLCPRSDPAESHRGGADLATVTGLVAVHVPETRQTTGRGPDFNDRRWKQGPGGFGTRGTPGIIVGTTWNTPDIWLRREVTLPASIDSARVQLLTYHDEGIEVYIDGILAAKESGYLSSYQPLEIFANAQRAAQARRERRAGRTLPSDGRWAGRGRRVDRCRSWEAVERVTIEWSTHRGRCEEPPRRPSASPPFVRGGHLRRSRPFLSPPYEGGARA